jgi:hypothetical protein
MDFSDRKFVQANRTLKIPCAGRFVEDLTGVHLTRRYHNPRAELRWAVGLANKRHCPIVQRASLQKHGIRFKSVPNRHRLGVLGHISSSRSRGLTYLGVASLVVLSVEPAAPRPMVPFWARNYGAR